MREEVSKYYINALIETINMMTGFNLIHKNADIYTNVQFELMGVMDLRGKQNVLLTISTNKATAAEIVRYMTGIDFVEQKETDLSDCLAELVNMVAGTVKSKLVESEHSYSLSSPFVVVGNEIQMITKRNVERYEYILSENEVYLRIGIYYL